MRRETKMRKIHFCQLVFIYAICQLAILVEASLEVDTCTDAVLFVYMLDKNITNSGTIRPGCAKINECCHHKDLVISALTGNKTKMEERLARCRHDMKMLKSCISKSRSTAETRVFAKFGKKLNSGSMDGDGSSSLIIEFENPKKFNKESALKPLPVRDKSSKNAWKLETCGRIDKHNDTISSSLSFPMTGMSCFYGNFGISVSGGCTIVMKSDTKFIVITTKLLPSAGNRSDLLTEEMKTFKELAMRRDTSIERRVPQFVYAVRENRSCLIELCFFSTRKLLSNMIPMAEERTDGNDKPATSSGRSPRNQSGGNSAHSQNHNTLPQGSNNIASFSGGTGGSGGEKRPPHKQERTGGCKSSETPNITLSSQEENSESNSHDDSVPDFHDHHENRGQPNESQIESIPEELFNQSQFLRPAQKMFDNNVPEHPLRPHHEPPNPGPGTSQLPQILRPVTKSDVSASGNEASAQLQQNREALVQPAVESFAENQLNILTLSEAENIQSPVITQRPSSGNIEESQSEISTRNQLSEGLDMSRRGQEAQVSERAHTSVSESNFSHDPRLANISAVGQLPPRPLQSSQGAGICLRSKNPAQLQHSAAGLQTTFPVSPIPESDRLFNMKEARSSEDQIAQTHPQTTQNPPSTNVIVEDLADEAEFHRQDVADLLPPALVQRNNQTSLVLYGPEIAQTTQNFAEDESMPESPNFDNDNQLEGLGQNNESLDEIQLAQNKSRENLEGEQASATVDHSDKNCTEYQSLQRPSRNNTSISMQFVDNPSTSALINGNITVPYGIGGGTQAVVENREQPLPRLTETPQADDEDIPEPLGPQECATVGEEYDQELDDEEQGLLLIQSSSGSSTAYSNISPDVPVGSVDTRQQQYTQPEKPPEVINPDAEVILVPSGPSSTELPNAQRDNWDSRFISPPRRPPDPGSSRSSNASHQMEQDQEDVMQVSIQETTSLGLIDAEVEQHIRERASSPVQRMEQAEEVVTRVNIQEINPLRLIDAEVERNITDTTRLQVQGMEQAEEDVTRVNIQQINPLRLIDAEDDRSITVNTPLQIREGIQVDQVIVETGPASVDSLPLYLVEAELEPLSLDAMVSPQNSLEEEPPYSEEETEPPGQSIYLFPWTPQQILTILHPWNIFSVSGIVNQLDPRHLRTFYDPPSRPERTFFHAPFHQRREMRCCLHCDGFFICLALMICNICQLPWCGACERHVEIRVHPDDDNHNGRASGDE